MRIRKAALRAAAKEFVRAHSSAIGSVVAVKTTQPHIVLTYDDGPVAGSTEKILEVLRRHDATATFFMLLSRARVNPTLVSEVVAAGHEVALHGLDHRPLTEFSFREVRRRTLAARSELEDLSGCEIRWVRPPYGKQTPATWLAVRRTGLVPVMWGPTVWDSRDVSQAERVSKGLEGAVRGAIVLAHDGYANALDGVDDGPPPRCDRAELADRLVSAYAARGLTVSSLSGALASGALQQRAWFGR